MKLRLLWLFTLLTLLVSFENITAQTIDEVRLGYDPGKVKAKQLSAAATADGKLLAFFYDNGKVKVFDLESQKFKSTFATSFKEVHDLRITPDGKVVVTAFQDVKVYDWKTGKELKAFTLSSRAARMDYNARHNIYVIGQMGGTFISFDLNSLTVLYSNKFGGFMINALALDPDAKYAAASFYSLGRNYLVKVIDIRTGEIFKTFERAKYQILSFDSKGNLLVHGWGNTGNFWYTIYDSSYSIIKSFEAPQQQYGYTDGAFAGNKAIFTTASLTLDVYDTDQQKLTYTSLADKSLVSIIGNFAYPKIIRISETKFLFSYGNYNILRLYDVSTNDVSAYFFTDGGDEFCVVSKDGRIDGDINALNAVYWTSRQSKAKTSLERTFERGFTPHLFSMITGVDNVAQQSFDVDALTANIPVLSIKSINGTPYDSKPVESMQKNTKVELALTGNASGINEIRLYHNGKLVRTVKSTGASNYTVDFSLNTAFGEENYIAAVASGTSGIESEKVKAVIRYKGSQDEKPKLFLVTIGINTYKNPKYNLNYAQADADGVETSMKKFSSGLFGEVIQYTIRNDKAVKHNIIKTIGEIGSKAMEQDVLMVYYAGHGILSEDSQGNSEFYLALHDLTQLYGKPELLTANAISASEIKTLTQSINAQKQVFLLDACQSGAALESASKRGVAEERAIAQLARSTGTFWITASGSTQFATEIEKLGHGIFTYAVLEGLSGSADSNTDGKLSIRELSVYIEDQVPLLTERYKGSTQYPSSYSFGNDFPIALYK
jgi:WD40 repeat protein